MNNNDDSPSAFPSAADASGNRQWGASLRDLFALGAMQALLQRGWVIGGKNDDELAPYSEQQVENNGPDVDTLAMDAYRVADAMINRRNMTSVSPIDAYKKEVDSPLT